MSYLYKEFTHFHIIKNIVILFIYIVDKHCEIYFEVRNETEIQHFSSGYPDD